MRTLTLNIIKGYGLDPVLNVSQLDKGYTVACTVQKGAEAFTPPTGSTATVEGRKPDGTGYQYAATIDGSTVTFTMAEQMTVLSGRSMAEIVFYDADAVRIGTANFYLLVEEAPLNESTVISETDLPTIQQALDLLKNGALAPGIISTASGDVAAFADGARDTALTSLAVNIDPVQSGTGDPSPSNIRPISGWTAVNVVRAGKNLIPNIKYQSNANNVYLGKNNARYDLYLPIGTYTLSVEYLNGAHSGAYYRFANDSANRSIWTSTSTAATGTITIDKNEPFNIWLYQSGGISADNIGNFQIEVGSTATTYEPYAGETFPVTLPTEAGTVYGGVVDPVKGTLTVNRRYITLDGTNYTFTINTAYPTTYTYYNNALGALMPPIASYQVTDALCNYLPSISRDNGGSSGGYQVGVFQVHSDSTNQFRMSFPREERFSTWDNLKAWLQSLTGDNRFVLCVPLKNTIEYDLTPTQIKTLYGYNTIYADCGGIESVEYTADTKMYIDSLITAMQSNIAYIESGTTATRAYTAGQYVIVGVTLYKVTASIASGATFTPGTNITATTVGAELTAL